MEIDKQEKEILEEEAKKQFELEYLVMPKALYRLDLNATELKILCFIISYNSEAFYFSNKHLSDMFEVSETSISMAINNLKRKGFLNIKYMIKANGGKIRFISQTNKLKELLISDFKNSLSRTLRTLKVNKVKDNKIKDNKKKNNIISSKIDWFLLEEYQKLYREWKGEDIQQTELLKVLEERKKETGKSINRILEEGIRKIKQKLNSDIPNEQINDIIQNVVEKVSINHKKAI
jgi:DNA-binding MarR family transcriptional regulator